MTKYFNFSDLVAVLPAPSIKTIHWTYAVVIFTKVISLFPFFDINIYIHFLVVHVWIGYMEAVDRVIS